MSQDRFIAPADAGDNTDRRNYDRRSQALRHLLDLLTAPEKGLSADCCVAGLTHDATTRLVKRIAFKGFVRLETGRWMPTALLEHPGELQPLPLP